MGPFHATHQAVILLLLHVRGLQCLQAYQAVQEQKGEQEPCCWLLVPEVMDPSLLQALPMNLVWSTFGLHCQQHEAPASSSRHQH